jgi:hypothetical protein
MGKGSREIDSGDLADDEPWIWERAKAYADSFEETRSKFISHFIDQPHEGHAYNSHTLNQLRRLLSLDEEKFSDKFLHDQTDALVVLIGRALIVTNAETTKERLQRLRNKLLAPTEKFLRALQRDDLTREFLHDDLPLNEDNREALHGHVEAFKVSVETHIETIALRSRKGKLELSRLCSGQVLMLSGLSFEGHGAFPAQC